MHLIMKYQLICFIDPSKFYRKLLGIEFRRLNHLEGDDNGHIFIINRSGTGEKIGLKGLAGEELTRIKDANVIIIPDESCFEYTPALGVKFKILYHTSENSSKNAKRTFHQHSDSFEGWLQEAEEKESLYYKVALLIDIKTRGDLKFENIYNSIESNKDKVELEAKLNFLHDCLLTVPEDIDIILKKDFSADFTLYKQELNGKNLEECLEALKNLRNKLLNYP
jgi:hypothetical protein